MSWSLSQSDLMATGFEGNAFGCPARARSACSCRAALFIALNELAMYSPRPTCANKGQHYHHNSSPPPPPTSHLMPVTYRLSIPPPLRFESLSIASHRNASMTQQPSPLGWSAPPRIEPFGGTLLSDAAQPLDRPSPTDANEQRMIWLTNS